MFKKNDKHTWIRVADGRVVEKALMDYVLIEKGVISRLKDVHVYRGETAGMSDHYLVEARVLVAKDRYNRVARSRREVVKIEELKKPEKRQEFQERVGVAYDRVKVRVTGELEEEWQVVKECLLESASEVCGKRFVGGGIRKGSEWWNEDVKVVVEEKKRAYEEWLQCRTREKYDIYRTMKVEVKRRTRKSFGKS